MKMKCPHCGVSGNTDKSLSGQRVKCPKCSKIFMVPESRKPQLTRVVPTDSHAKEVGNLPGSFIDDELQERAEGTDENKEPERRWLDGDGLSTGSFPTENSDQHEYQENTPEAGLEIQADFDRETESSTDDIEDIPRDPEHDQPLDLEIAEVELQAELEDLLAGTCCVCGKSVEERQSASRAEVLCCQSCFAKESAGQERLDQGGETAAAAIDEELASGKRAQEDKIRPFSQPGEFSAGLLIKESWAKTHGVKGSLWAGIVVMFLVLFAFGGVAVYLLSHSGNRAGTIVVAWLKILSQITSTFLSITFLSGLINIGIRWVAGQSFSWNLVFSGFSRIGSIVIAGFLMSLLITSGLLLFVLPGIYLAVGYSLTLPVIMDKRVGPWEAMEMSRQAIHKKWWQVFGAYLIMYLIYVLSLIPFGIGMIWTVPMFFTLTAVIYRTLFEQEAD